MFGWISGRLDQVPAVAAQVFEHRHLAIGLAARSLEEAHAGGPDEAYTQEQLEKMLEFTRMLTTWYSQIDRLSTTSLQRLFRGGARLAKLFAPAAKEAPEQETADFGKGERGPA